MKKIFCLITLITIFCLPGYSKNISGGVNRLDYVNMPFWETFGDEILSDHILDVYKNNRDLKIAMLRVSEAQRLVKMSFADQLPYLGFNGKISHVFSSSDEVFGDIVIPNYSETQFLFPAALSYEVDIWGKNYLKTKSKSKQFEMMLQNEKSAYIALTSAFAANYFNLVKIDELINLQNQLIDVQSSVVKAFKTKYELGTATVNDVLAQEKALTYLREELKSLLEKRDVLQNQTSVLLADKSFGHIDRKSYAELNCKPSVPEKIAPDFIDNRPDFVKAELALERAGIDVRVAKREFLPDFTIVGNLGFNFYSISSANTFLSAIGVLPDFDIFSGGRKIQNLKFKKDEYKIAVENYEKSILTAMQETNDALYTLKTARDKHSLASERLKLSEREMFLVNEKQKIGTADNLSVLFKQESLLTAKKSEVSNKINSVTAMIGLYGALGGVNFVENL